MKEIERENLKREIDKIVMNIDTNTDKWPDVQKKLHNVIDGEYYELETTKIEMVIDTGLDVLTDEELNI